MRETSGIRRCGAACIDLAWVASGRLDAYWDAKLEAWDVAAGILLIREAGGIVTDLHGAPSKAVSGGIAAGNPNIHKQLMALLKTAP